MQKARTIICACYVHQFLFSKLHSSDGITKVKMQFKKNVFSGLRTSRDITASIYFPVQLMN